MVLSDVIKKQYRWWWLAVLCAAVGGCSFGLGKPSLTSPDPALRIPAMKQAAARRNAQAIPALLTALASHDPAVRFYANVALEAITGRHFGYVYYGSRCARQAAIRRWRQWYAHSKMRGR